MTAPNSSPAGKRDSHDRDGDTRPPRGHEDRPQTTPRDRGAAEDAGRTSGGGSSGHKQPEDVTDAAPIRNNPR
jgi:hypothetical protein